MLMFRRQFLVSCLLVTVLPWPYSLALDSSTKEGDCDNPETGVRLVTADELAQKTGENGSEIWLSIIGDVFDVTTGEEFYGKGRSYGAFAGRDASVPFVTGVFTAEEAQKSADVISMKELGGLLEWHTFYETHKEYSFVGRLIDPRYYDEKGHPTPDLESLQGRLETVKAEQEAKRKKKKR